MREQLGDLGGAIVKASRRIEHIVHDLLGFGRPQAEDRADAVDLDRVVMEALDDLHESPEGAAHRLVLALAGDLPPVQGCPRRLTQVVVNLVQNALQAVGTGGGEVRVATTVVGDRVRLTVSDDGPGIPAADLDRVRDPFFTTKRDAGGTGLGLWICAYIVDEHGGGLHLDSTPGSGATVEVELPAIARGGSA